MAEPDQPKKETVRIELPLPPATNPPKPIVEPRETARVQLPVRETLAASVRSAPASPPPGLKSDTVRIPLNLETLRASQKKTESLTSIPQLAPQNPSVGVATVKKSSMLLYWVLLGLSALILIIEIWTYFS